MCSEFLSCQYQFLICICVHIICALVGAGKRISVHKLRMGRGDGCKSKLKTPKGGGREEKKVEKFK